jgi:hypothetical protein
MIVNVIVREVLERELGLVTEFNIIKTVLAVGVRCRLWNTKTLTLK